MSILNYTAGIATAVLDFLDKYNGAVTAVATVFIAAFTIVLALVTGRQARLSRQAIDLARDEFTASHRPYLIVRDVCLDGNNVAYLLINKGDARATIVESWILLERVADGHTLRPLRSFGHDDLGKISFAIGEVKEMTYPIPHDIAFSMTYGHTRRIATNVSPPFHGSQYFTGTIVYEDASGHRRRSVFRRLWNQSSGGGGSFERLAALDQEYAE